jgi:hypothetical protein
MSQTGKREDGKPLQPYKFLDPHTLQDKTIFFGRGQEIEILLADIVVNRLVVLFARTGMGKTSLIQAGVWPRLVDLGYKPVYLPTGGNPTESAIEALTKEGLLPQSLAKESWATHLMRGRGQGRLQIVLFFDQFEMFFNQVRKREDRRQFISDIAAIYHSRGSGIHIVFSMREEYYHHMDDFRDQIPSIFNRGSSLRLRPLTPEQAEEAIVGPAKLFDLQVEPELVERLKRDLAEEEGIEPARLEIVCNTLWRESRRPQNDGVPLLDLYKELGHGIGNPADRIYNRRLEEDIDGNLEDRQLELFEKLLPMLRTTRDTKYPRDLGELEDSLERVLKVRVPVVQHGNGQKSIPE